MSERDISEMRAVLIEVLSYHVRLDIEQCACGWAGTSFVEHVADVFIASLVIRYADE